MSRQILCLECAGKKETDDLDARDVERGWTARRVYMTVHPKESLPVAVLRILRCDGCNVELNNEMAAAITRTPPGKTIPAWEHLYGTIMPEDAVEVTLILTRKKSPWKFIPSCDHPVSGVASADLWINQETDEIVWEDPKA